MSYGDLKGYRLVLNMVKCLLCKQILLSAHRHDFRMCDCPNGTFTDGGTTYIRRGGKNHSLLQPLDMYLEEDKPRFWHREDIES